MERIPDVYGAVLLEPSSERRREEYWDWVAVSLFLLVTVDLLTSMYAAEAVGLAHESNPVMAYLLSQSLILVIAAHIIVVLVAVVLFYGLHAVAQAGSRGGVAWLCLEAYLGLLVVAGLFVFANNLSVIVLGDSLL